MSEQHRVLFVFLKSKEQQYADFSLPRDKSPYIARRIIMHVGFSFSISYYFRSKCISFFL